MSQGPRVMRPERHQPRWDIVDLDSQLPPDHRARLVWSWVETLELGAFYARIKARDETAGRPASDPAVLLALWLYATLEGIGSARAIARLCQLHAAYRWLCGGVAVNHDLLASFRRESGDELDGLLTQSLTVLIGANLLSLAEVMTDGTKVQARAGRGSLAKEPRLDRIEARVSAHIIRLKQQLEADPGGPQREREQRALRAAEDQQRRLNQARETLAERLGEKQVRAGSHAKAEAEKAAPSVSTSDPEVRSMKMADGATRPAWNVQVSTAQGFVVAIEPTDRRNDSGLAGAMVAQIEQRCGVAPTRLLADTTAMTQDDIVALAEQCPGLTVYSPTPAERDDVTEQTRRRRQRQRECEPEVLRHWRERMASEAGRLVYRARKLTEHVHARMKNRGFARMPVHGRRKVRAVCLLHALAHNLMHAHARRAATA